MPVVMPRPPPTHPKLPSLQSSDKGEPPRLISDSPRGLVVRPGLLIRGSQVRFLPGAPRNSVTERFSSAYTKMSLADAGLVRMSETLAGLIILTTDADFR